tara:strand:- start:9 stop:275 length:267 start_codon:yes stop_codon:yes gene_type:complete
MPRYRYQCKLCLESIVVIHGIDECYTDCEKCKSSNVMVKLLSKPVIQKKGDVSSSTKTGQLTHEYIEANKEILQKQKDNLKESEYDPS